VSCVLYRLVDEVKLRGKLVTEIVVQKLMDGSCPKLDVLDGCSCPLNKAEWSFEWISGW
jgi:hypothetical protein